MLEFSVISRRSLLSASTTRIEGTQIREKNDKFQQRKLNTMFAAKAAVQETAGDADMEVTSRPPLPAHTPRSITWRACCCFVCRF